MHLEPDGCVVLVAVASRWWRRILDCCPRCCWRWLSRHNEAIRCRRCAGPARACGGLRRTDRTGPSGQPHRGWRTAGTAELQPAANSKTREGGDHPDRDAQFLHIDQSVTEAFAAKQPVISVDTKKKELFGDFKNAGRAWRPKAAPEEVRVHDFLIKELGRAVPYGIYDLAANAGWVSVGMDHDTAEFAVQTIRRWWYEIGRIRYPDAKHLVITADGGGSNGSRVVCGNANSTASPARSASTSRSTICRLAPASGTRSSIACSHS